MIEIRGLTVRYGRRLALSQVDIDVEPGSSLAVIGPNGSGKSTLLRAIARLVTPDAGSIDRGGATVSMVLQSTEIDRAVPVTVHDAMRMARYPHTGLVRPFGRRDRAAIDAALERLDIADLRRRQIHELSGGQRQRVLVAQGVAQEADILLLDEPVNGLDVRSRALILDLVDAERDAGRTVLVSTHHLDDARRCDRVLLLDGRVLAIGEPEEVLASDVVDDAFGARPLGGHGEHGH